MRKNRISSLAILIAAASMLAVLVFSSYKADALPIITTSPSPSLMTSIPAAPTNLLSKVIASNTVTLTWQESSTNITGFKVERTDNGTAYSVIGTAPAGTLTYSDTSGGFGPKTGYRVYAYNSYGSSGYSNLCSYTSGVAELSALGLNSGTLIPVFYSETKSYTVSTTADSLKFQPESMYVVKTITINGTVVNSGAWSPAFPLAMGTNTFVITAISLDGTKTETYTITATRTNGIIGAVTHFSISPPQNQSKSVSESATFSVSALDDSGNTVTGYTGTVHYTSSDSKASLPSDGTLTNGVGTVSAKFFTSGSQTLTASDKANSTVTGTSQAITIHAGSPVSLKVEAPGIASVGIPINIGFALFDQYGNICDWDESQLKFTSTDSAAVLPPPTVTKDGVYLILPVTFKTPGSQTITAVAIDYPPITATSGIINVAKSINANLSAITPDTGSLSPVFSPLNTAYTLIPDSTKSTVSIACTTEESHATVVMYLNGVANNTNSLNGISTDSANTLDIKVTAQNSTTTQTYHVAILAKGSVQPDYSTASGWALGELQQAVADKLVTNKVITNFQQNITRDEFCGLAVKLYEALSGKTAQPTPINPFTDTTDNDTLKAYNLGIVKGVTPTSFAPNNSITRQEICVMLFRAIMAAKPYVDINTSDVAPFADENQIASWAIDNVRFCSKHTIMKGTGNNAISPLNSTTREQAIILVKRAFEGFLGI